MTCLPCGTGGPLPITTGRIGISQTDGSLSFYGHNFRGVGMGLFHGQSVCWTPPYGAPGKGGWGGGRCGSCGCSPCCCQDNTACFTYLLTNLGPWCCYWRDQEYAAWLTGKQPWPTTAAAANTALANSLPQACFPVLPSPPYPQPTASA